MNILLVHKETEFGDEVLLILFICRFFVPANLNQETIMLKDMIENLKKKKKDKIASQRSKR